MFLSDGVSEYTCRWVAQRKLAMGEALHLEAQPSPRGCIRPLSNGTPIVHPVKVCLAAGYSSGSRHPSKGWVRPKQAGWEFRVSGLGFRV